MRLIHPKYRYIAYVEQHGAHLQARNDWKQFEFEVKNQNGKWELTHMMIEPRSNTYTRASPGYGKFLHGFEHLMRHVFLWKEKAQGRIS